MRVKFLTQINNRGPSVSSFNDFVEETDVDGIMQSFHASLKPTITQSSILFSYLNVLLVLLWTVCLSVSNGHD